MRRMALTTVLSTFAVTIAAATSLTAQAAQLFVGPPGSNSPPGGTAVGGESNLLSGNLLVRCRTPGRTVRRATP